MPRFCVQVFGFATVFITNVVYQNTGPVSTAAWSVVTSTYISSAAAAIAVGCMCVGDIDNNGYEDL